MNKRCDRNSVNPPFIENVSSTACDTKLGNFLRFSKEEFVSKCFKKLEKNKNTYDEYTCYAKNSTQTNCDGCDPDRYLNGIKCSKCSNNCSYCDQSDICKACIAPYY